MTYILIVLALLALGVGVVVWASRQKPKGDAQAPVHEQDTAWNDPITPADEVQSTPAPAPAPTQESRS